MKKSFFDKRIPTFFALFILIVGIGVTIVLLNQGVFITTRATPQQKPQNITITNVDSNSLTVAFTTIEKTVAAVLININGKEELIFDSRDGNEKTSYFSHQITISNLQPNTTYNFKILSNGVSFPENEGFLQAKTFEEISQIPPDLNMKGSVILPNGEVGSDVMIFITPSDGASASAVTDNNGEFTISSRFLKNISGKEYLSPFLNIPLKIRAVRQNFESIVDATFIPNGIIPPIALSENYEFIAQLLEEEIASTPSSSLFTEPDPKVSNILQILTPKDNETLVDNRPQFRGTAPAGSIVRIIIDGTNAAQLRSSPNGNWSFRPSAPLSPGSHTLSVVSGNRTVSQRFAVFSSGSQIAQTATPSATLTPTLLITSPTPTEFLPSPTLETIPTPTGISVTSIPIGAPTQEFLPSPTPTYFVPTKIPLPAAGIADQSILLTGAALLFILAGSILFFIL